MNKLEFLDKIVEELEIESSVDLNTNFKELEEWDSLNLMVLIGLVSKHFDISLGADDIEKSSTFDELIETIGYSKFDE